MSFFHHSIIKKYTLALLSTFNGVEIQRKLTSGNYSSNFVPITFGVNQKSQILDAYETKELLNGNYNVLPRMSLIFNSLTYASERASSKFNKINKHLINENGEDSILQYQYNRIPYDFSFTIFAKCNTMNEATMIAEQIISYFNPVYYLKLNEIPLQSEPTSIPLLLNDVSFDYEEVSEISSDVVTLTFDLTLKGNIYPAIKDQEKIKEIRIYNGLWQKDEYQRASEAKWEKSLDYVTESNPHGIKRFLFNFTDGEDGETIGKFVPMIESIIGEEVVDLSLNASSTYLVKLVDEKNDNKMSELNFIYNIVPDISSPFQNANDIGTLSADKDRVLFTTNLTSGHGDISFKIQCICTDIHSQISDPFYKNIVLKT